jgi:hypothetical protein
MAGGSNAPFSGEYDDLENIPTLPEGVTATEATKKFSGDFNDLSNVPKKTIYKADFENDKNGWTFTTNTTRESNQANTGSFSAEVYNDDREIDGIEREFNLDDIIELEFSYGANNAMFGRYLVKVGGNIVFDTDRIEQSPFATAIIDVSGFSGTQKIEILVENRAGGFHTYYIDTVFVREENPFREVLLE